MDFSNEMLQLVEEFTWRVQGMMEGQPKRILQGAAKPQ